MSLVQADELVFLVRLLLGLFIVADVFLYRFLLITVAGDALPGLKSLFLLLCMTLFGFVSIHTFDLCLVDGVAVLVLALGIRV